MTTLFILLWRLAIVAVAVLFSSGLIQAQTAYVSMNGSGSIKIVSSDSLYDSTLLADGLAAPKAVAFDSAGNLYVAEDIDGTLQSVVTRIDPSGHKTTYATGLQRPVGLAFGTDGTLYVSDYNGPASSYNAIWQVAPGGGAATPFVSGSALNSPFGLAFGSGGNLLVANRDDGSIAQVAGDGTITTYLAAGTFNQPNDLAFGSGGDLFVSNFGDNSVSKVSGLTVTTYGAVNTPVGLAYDMVSGRLLVASQGDSWVYAFEAGGGSAVQFAYFNGDSPQYLAVATSAVPEPATYAMLAGLAVLGFAVRRRAPQKSSV